MGAPVQVYWVKRIDNSRLVRQRDPGCLRESMALLGAAVLTLGVVLLCSWQHFQTIHAGYQLEELQTRHQQLLEWNRTLRLEQAVLLDPMRVDFLARQHLGLGDPEAGQLVPLGPRPGRAPAPAFAWATPRVAAVGTAVAGAPLQTSLVD